MPEVQVLTIEDEQANCYLRVLLIFIHGAFTGNQRYIALFRNLQEQSLQKGIRLDIGYGSYAYDIPNKDETALILEQLNDNTSGKNTYDAKLIAGHSMGALVATEVSMPSTYDALVCLCSSFQFSDPARSLASYPKPVLTLCGDRDGFMRHHLLSNDMISLESELGRRSSDSTGDNGSRQREQNEMDITKPIIVLKDVNHMQAADDIVAEAILNTLRHDFQSGLMLEEAHEKMAQAISSFILITVLRVRPTLLQKRGKEYELYLESCQKQLQQTRLTREALRSFRDLSNESFISDFAKDVQRSIVNLKDNLAITTNFHDGKEDFLYSKPTVSQTLSVEEERPSEGTISTIVQIHIIAQAPIKLHPDLPATAAQLSPTHAIKAKGQGFFQSLTKGGEPMSLCEINQQTFDKVLEEYVTKEQRTRYEEKGRKLEFGPDLIVSNPPTWVDTPLEINHNGNNTTCVRSPVSLTSVGDEIPPKFRGMFYAKPMAPSQMYEWIAYDAFRKIPSS